MRREWIVEVAFIDLERCWGVGLGPEKRRRRRGYAVREIRRESWEG